MPTSEEFPLEEEQPFDRFETSGQAKGTGNPQVFQRGFHRGMEFFLRFGLHTAAIVLVVVFGWLVRYLFVESNIETVQLPQQAALAAPVNQVDSNDQNETETAVTLPVFTQDGRFRLGIPRFAILHTTIPNRPRVEVITYTVQSGDTVFGIAERFGLKPETIFWGNQAVLNDDPHKLFPGQVLNILPVDGVYHQWSTGENLDRVAEFYGVASASILEYPGNFFDLLGSESQQPSIEAGTWLIVPDGKREFVDFGPPRITRSNPAVARTYGPGHCGSIYDGATGSGVFLWPTTERYLSGYDYNPAANHSGIDIAGDTGNPIFAADSGVVVYAGWSYFGYGNLVVIDHGNWQTLYAHLNDFYVGCGQSVFAGATIAALGNTGNSSGSHLHFELMYQSAKVNPWDYVSP